ncbi:Cysteine-rich receptor-like protein kinase 2 [Acorus gramineus]|uniref:Cysteine-rich receptor-like protein kinase 2 n=1 Tax=Acorus gramineus TaxID=55184 RepID=A0AAV9BYC7_ACOGR|nr:Cysteine-rich receptor-like protein kinase 2 [Acorus gramineus]
MRRKRRGLNDPSKMAYVLRDKSLNFKYSTLEKATGSFNPDNKLGEGGFGTVYKGAFADGREIAVKRLFFHNRHRAMDFFNEVNIISSVEHKNLVRLLGCCCSGPESLLVYEYLPNKSLDLYIFDREKGKELNWERRFKIITGTAQGLLHLHENPTVRIIHRDIKASNILLDSKLQVKIADFGLARSFEGDESHISTAIAGTLGYMAPEYVAHGRLTERADVYSFGVLVLEIITGRKNGTSKTSEYTESLLTISWKHYQSGSMEELIDPNITHGNNNNSIGLFMRGQILRTAQIAFLCTQENPSLRPTMSRALQMLLRRDEDLPVPTNPPFTDEDTMQLYVDSHRLLDRSSLSSVATVSHSSFCPR